MSVDQNIDFSALVNDAVTRQLKLSKSNKLLHFPIEKTFQVDNNKIKISKSIENIYRFSNRFQKQFGINPTLLISHYLIWTDPNTNANHQTPLICLTIALSKKKDINPYYTYQKVGEPFLNPVLKKYFEEIFGVDLPEQFDQVQTVLKEITDRNNIDFSESNSLPNQHKWAIIETQCIGNFDYSSIYLVSDLQKITNDNSPNWLPGNAALKNFSFVDQYDISQREFCEKALQGDNLVLQGPPGTGKSQTIVNLIASYLSEKKTVLMVSAKKAALDVVESKMSEANLKDLTFKITQPNASLKSAYKDLAQQFEKWETIGFSEKKSVPHHAFLDKEDTIRNYINAKSIYREELKSSIFEAEKEIAKTDFNLLNISPNLPSFSNWIEQKNKIEKQQDLLKSNLWFMLSDKFLSEKLPFEKWEQKIHQVCETSQILYSSIPYLSKIENLTFSNLQKYSALAGSLQNIPIHTLKTILNNKRKRASLAKQIRVLKSLAVYEDEDLLFYKKWSVFPTLEATVYIEKLFNNRKPGKFWDFKARKINSLIHRFFEQYSEEKNTYDKISLLEHIKVWYKRSETIKKAQSKLIDDFNIAIEKQVYFSHIEHLLAQIETNNDFYESLQNVDNLEETLESLFKEFQTIENLKHALLYLFENPFEIELKYMVDWSLFIDQNKNLWYPIKHQVVECISAFSIIEKKTLFNTYERNHSFENTLLYSSLHNLYVQEPILKLKTDDWLIESLLNYTRDKNEKQSQNRATILSCYTTAFEEKNTLIHQNTNQLNAADKKLKQSLKKAKRYLIKETNKTRQHDGYKLLYEHCKDWIDTLKPVHLMSPEAVSALLPTEQNVFDVVIFDEASQIPFDKALPALYRAKQAIVVGDPQQMPPSSFFEKTDSYSESLLDYFYMQWKTEMLTWHYRSKNPALISFSNHYFYRDKLHVFPATSDLEPFIFNKIENGVFENNCNNVEAKSVAEFALDKNKKHPDLSIGIVALSQKQANTIESYFPDLPDQISITNLENIQGDEKDIIIISIGYGYNNEGKFIKNFGPINQVGGLQRLNVLFTRAIQQNIVFSSVLPQDFGISENDGVTLLKKYIQHVIDSNKTQLTPLKELNLDDVFNYKSDFISYYAALSSLQNKSIKIKT